MMKRPGPQGYSAREDTALAAWALDALTRPRQSLHGEDAAEYGRQLLTDAGVDVDAVRSDAWQPPAPS